MGNIVLKITALIFGIALWFLVISQKDFQLSVEVPLNFVKLPETMAIASKPPHTLHITVEGKPLDLIRLRPVMQDPSRMPPWSSTCRRRNSAPRAIHLDAKNFIGAEFPEHQVH